MPIGLPCPISTVLGYHSVDAMSIHVNPGTDLDPRVNYFNHQGYSRRRQSLQEGLYGAKPAT
jgi:hypothetical protein